MDFDDPKVEEAWCKERRGDVTAYMRGTGTRFGSIPEWPAWHVPPFVSVWPVESGVAPGRLGWWVICGDLPTDYLSGNDAADPREAVRAIATRWQEVVSTWERGQEHPAMEIGGKSDRAQLLPLLKGRAKVLLEWCEDDSLWD